MAGTHAGMPYSDATHDDAHAPRTRHAWPVQVNESERTYALFTHLIGLVQFTNAAVPLLPLIATIVMWRIKAKESAFLDDHGREATNFQISLIVWVLIGVLAGVLLSIVTLGIAIPLVIAGGVIGGAALFVLTIVGSIRGAMAAQKGEWYRYPATFRWIRSPVDEG